MAKKKQQSLMAPFDARETVLNLMDEADVLAVIVRQGDDVGVQVFGPATMELVTLLEQAVRGLRQAIETGDLM